MIAAGGAELLGLLAIPLTIGLVAVGVVLGRHVLIGVRWHRPIRLLDDPVPEAWHSIVRDNFPLARRLDEARFERLLRLVQLFVHEKRFDGAGGLELTDEIRVTIAAQACYLILDTPLGLYPDLRTVIVYPAAFRPKSADGSHRNPRQVATLGESWGLGVVVLSWDSVLHGAFDPKDGRNVALHEFAHQLDQEDGDADGVPAGMAPTAIKTWARIMGKRYKQLRRARDRGRRSVMNQYGATNRAEFFAVATETFFEKPHQLLKKKEDVYRALADFYNRDPVAEARNRSS